LAGSERSSLTGTTGRALQESIYINKSLFTLRKVIAALSVPKYRQNAVHIPFRDSKLTSLLQHSLGGNSITLMIACVNPSNRHRDENLSTLEYAARTKRIVNVVFVNEDVRSRTIRQLREENAMLRAQITEMKGMLATSASGSNHDVFAVSTWDSVGPNAQSVNVSSIDVNHGGDVPYSESDVANGGTLEEMRSRNAVLAAKIVHSMRAIKDLLERNERYSRELSEQEAAEKELEDAHNEAMMENAELRERIDILESVLLLDGEEVARLQENGEEASGREGILTADKAIVLELLELRKENASLNEKLSIWEESERNQNNSRALSARRQSQSFASRAGRPHSAQTPSPYENKKSTSHDKNTRGASRAPRSGQGLAEKRPSSLRQRTSKNSEAPLGFDTEYDFGSFKEALDTAQKIQAQRATGTLPFTLGDLPTIFPSGRVSTTGGRLGKTPSNSQAGNKQGRIIAADRAPLDVQREPWNEENLAPEKDDEVSRLLRQLRSTMRVGSASPSSHDLYSV